MIINYLINFLMLTMLYKSLNINQ